MTAAIEDRWPGIRELTGDELNAEQLEIKCCWQKKGGTARFYRIRRTGHTVFVVVDTDAPPEVAECAADKILGLHLAGYLGAADGPMRLQ